MDEYATSASQEIVPAKKEQAHARLEKFKSDLHDMRAELERLKKVRAESVYEASRSELITRRVHGHARSLSQENGSDPSSLSENPYTGPIQQPQYTDYSRAEGLSREQATLGRVGDQLDEFLERGKLVLENLGEQREMLKATRRRIYGVANTLGISTDTIRMVERRATADKRFFYGGIVVLLVCFYYILRWFGWWWGGPMVLVLADDGLFF